MPNDDGQKAKASVKLSLGKEIDAALGDVIRGLLRRPSEEAGNLLADGIGLLGDRVRKKRMLNAQNGLVETRELLDSKGVELKDITPPDEEDLHILLEGMSVSGDERVRKLWSGLLASTLDPNDNQGIERPFTSAISSLSPADARIVEYVAYVAKNERSINRDAREAAGLSGKEWLTYGDSDRIEEERQKMRARLTEYIETAAQMEAEFELEAITSNSDWPENLVRLGIIEPKPEDYGSSLRHFDFRGERGDGKFEALLKHVEERIQEAEGLALEGLEIGFLFKRDNEEQRITLGVRLTRFGERLCNACGLL